MPIEKQEQIYFGDWKEIAGLEYIEFNPEQTKILNNYVKNLLLEREKEIKEKITGLQDKLDQYLFDWDAYPNSDQQAKGVIEMILLAIDEK